MTASKSTWCANGKHLAGSEVREKGVKRCAISGAYQRILAYREQGIAGFAIALPEMSSTLGSHFGQNVEQR